MRFERDGDYTRLRRHPGFGPLYVQKPFHPEPPCTHIYVIHPPGGIVGGDTLSIAATLDTAAHALITTPAATKLYRADGTGAKLEQTLVVGRDAVLEWLPLETIAFDGSDVDVSTTIELAKGACVFAWEMTVFGRRAGDRPFTRGRVSQTTRIGLRSDAGLEPLLLERCQLDGGSRRQQAPWGFGAQAVNATAWFAPADRSLGSRLTEALGDKTPHLSITVPDRVLVIRGRGHDIETLFNELKLAWATLRPMTIGRCAAPPRIWNT
ncbi:MAG: urease accessory protein UreD [Pseudomonadota bacterium]